jgi:hypothetical protein
MLKYLGWRVLGLVVKIWRSGFEVYALEIKFRGLGLGVGFYFQISVVGFRVSGFGLRGKREG